MTSRDATSGAPRRLTLRTRLTALYAMVFVLAAGALLALTLTLVSTSLDRAAAANSPAQQKYRANLEAALIQADQAAANGKPDADLQKKRAHLKQQLIEANAASGDTLRAGTVNTLLGASLLAIVVLVPASGLGGWLLAGRALRPVGAITEAARRASDTRLHERLALRGPRDEITNLADTFDTMLDRLEHAFDAQRRFVANASHELRTPLAVARTAIDVTLAKPQRTTEHLERMAADVHGAINRAEHLVEGLLTLTRSQHLAHAAEPTDLATAAQDALDLESNEINACALTVHAHLEPAPATGDRALLDRLVSNLINNAIRHNQPDGWLSVHTHHDGQHAVITIANTGPPIEPTRVPELFQPFHRADGPARSNTRGLGLGLSIVRAVADAHHAQITADARPDGGLAITIRLPPQTAN
jgi:signal transduction histidine kinase